MLLITSVCQPKMLCTGEGGYSAGKKYFTGGTTLKKKLRTSLRGVKLIITVGHIGIMAALKGS